MFAKRELFCALVSAVTGDEVDLDGDPHSQATLREEDVLLNKIQFDIFGTALNKNLYTADMQRSYKEARLERRTVYYVCRAISTQKVEDMHYEDLNPVNIAFILTDDKNNEPLRIVKLCDINSFEVFDDLIDITLVYIPAVIRNWDKKSDLYLFARFFAIDSQDEADKFVNEFEMTDLGRELIFMYNNAVADVNQLAKIENSPYFVGRLTEAQLDEERKKAKKKGAMENSINIALEMLADGF